MQRTRSALVVAALLTLSAACSKPKPVKVTPRSGQVESIGPNGIGLSLLLDVHNPNSFDIYAKEVRGVLELSDGTELGRGSAMPAAPIPANGMVTVPAKLQVGFTNLAALTPFALSGAPVPYRIRGSAAIGGDKLNVEVPFTVSGELTREQVIQAALRRATGTP